MGKDSKLGIEGYWLALAGLVLLIFFLASESEAAEIEIGPTFLSGDYAEGGIMLFTERVGVWSFGAGYVSEQFVATCGKTYGCIESDLRENIFFQVQRIVVYKQCEIGIGPAYFQNTNRALGARTVFAISFGCGSERWFVRARHYSNAGSATPNLGQDALTIGYRF